MTESISLGRTLSMESDNDEETLEEFRLRVISEVNAALAALEARIVTLEGALAALEARIVTLEGALAALEARIVTLEGALAALEARIVTLEGA